MEKIYLLSSDNGYHWITNIHFASIEEAVIYYVNERLDDYSYDWKSVKVIDIVRPYKDQSNIECHIVAIDNDGIENKGTVYISESTIDKPENKYRVVFYP